MPKMEPTGLFIAKEREDERAKVEDRLAKYCGRKTVAEKLLQGSAGVARARAASGGEEIAAGTRLATRGAARDSWTAG